MLPEQPIADPPVASVRQTARAYLRERWGWWLLLLIPLTAAWLGLVVRWWLDGTEKWWEDDALYLPLIAVWLYWTAVVRWVRGRFWRQFAQAHGFTYQPKGDPNAETAVMFHQGHSRRQQHIITGSVENRPLRISNYQFTIGHGKYSRTYPYTVFEFRFTGHFPHLYLNQLFNGYGIAVGVAIPLPREFEKRFTLRAPQEYEIEALQIFTPDLLAHLLDSGLQHDVEIVDQELLIFTVGYVDRREQLEREFADATALVERLAPKLDRFRFAPIGDHPPSLTR